MTLHPILYWFGIYMAFGLVILVIARLLAALNRRAGPSISWVREMMEAIEVTNCGSSRWQQVAEKLLLPTLVWLFWPFAMALIMQSQSFAANRTNKPDPQAALSCQRQHLVRIVSPEAVESVAKTIDPRGRVSDLPFGHLNPGWHALLADRQIGDTLWYFEVPGAKRGYALVQSGKVRKEFVFELD